MSVLIKGMEMPTNCESCPCKTSDAFGGLGCQATGYIPLRKANQDRPDWCPFVPVPSHGRLIDADAAVVAIQNSIEVVHDGMQKILLDYAQKMFNATPTIIESEASR